MLKIWRNFSRLTVAPTDKTRVAGRAAHGRLLRVKMSMTQTKCIAMKTSTSLLCLLVIGISTSTAIAADPPPISIEGTWQCGPYTMTTAKFTATGSNKVNYKRGGSYYDFAIMTITTTDGTKTTLNTQTDGTWSQSGEVLTTKAVTVQVLSSDNPRYPIEAAQRAANEQQAKQETVRNRIRVRNTSMTLRPVNPASKETDIDVVCRRL